MSLRRRSLLLSAALVSLGIGTVGAWAADKPDKLTIVSHAVHKKVSTEGQGGDVTAVWTKDGGVPLEWLTFGVEETNERAFREASLANGNVDVAFILDRFGGPQIASLFEDLGAWQAKEPIEDFDEISAGMRAAHTHNGKLIAIPFRHATHGLLYNEALFKERGLDAPPKTFEEVLAYAEKLTYTRDDGTKVHGIVISMDDPSSISDWIRAFGGDFITKDYQVVVNEPAAVKAITALRDMAQKGVLPKNVTSFKTEDVTTFMQQGRAAMTNNPFGRFVNYNDPKASKFPGQFKVMPIPMAEGLKGPHPSKTSVWAMAIPANAPNKELSWSLIKHLSSKESTILEALNGNGPVRLSAYQDPRVREKVPYADAEAAVLANAALVVPGFSDTGKAMDILMEEVEAVMVGAKEPQEAMDEAKARVEPLLPKS